MLEFTPAEQAIASVIKQLKAQAGSHAPSLSTIMERVPQLTIHVDACFLSNPYAADLFFQSVTQELIVTNKIQAVKSRMRGVGSRKSLHSGIWRRHDESEC